MKKKKCNTDKYRRQQKKEKIAHKVHQERRRKERMEQAAYNERCRREMEFVHYEKKRLRKRLLQLVVFRMWQQDPEYYDSWARKRYLNSILGLWGMKLPEIEKEALNPWSIEI
jgi:hypothetical protein